MSDIISTLPVELRRQIFGRSDPHTLAQVALVSHRLSLDATDLLYRHIDSPWPLIMLLNARVGEGMEESYDSFSLAEPISEERLARFCEVAGRVRSLSWQEDLPGMCAARCSLASAQIHNLAPGDLLPRARSLFASSRTPHGVRAIMPWLSTSLEEVDVAFGPDVDDATAISCLQLVRICTGVTALTFTLDSSNFSRRREGVVDALIGAIGAMPRLHKVSVPLELVTPGVLDALAALPNLHTLILTPATSPLVWEVVDIPSFIFSVTPDDSASSRETSQGSWSPAPRAQGQAELLDELSPMAHLQDLPFVCDAPQPIPHVEISRFSTLHNLQTSATSWAEVATIVRNMEPGLRHLVVFLPEAQSSLETAALETIRDYCPRANIDVRYV